MRSLWLAFVLWPLGVAWIAPGEGPTASTRAGELLLAEASCTACHAAPAESAGRLAPRKGPDLAAIGARYEPFALRRFLLRPHAVRPGTPMPDLLAGLPEAERQRAADELMHFLAAMGGPIDLTPAVAGLDELEHGRRLYHSVGCVACHAPVESADELLEPLWGARNSDTHDSASQETPSALEVDTLPPRDAPLLDLDARTTVAQLARFLADPLATRPAGRMPAMHLNDAEARAIATYLLRDQVAGGIAAALRQPGLAYEYFEGPMRGPSADFSALLPLRRGVALDLGLLPEHRPNGFGFRFRGELEVPVAGTWRFFTSSDDGSRLFLDGRLVVRNDGIHPLTQKKGELVLEAGFHALVIEYFEFDGQEGLEVRWEGPDVPLEIIPSARLAHVALELAPRGAQPLSVDPALASAGRARFRELACGACHSLGEERDVAPAREARALTSLDATAPGGCLDETPAAGRPRYALEAFERAAIAALLATPALFAAPLAPAEQVARSLERFQCLQCHERDGGGGVHLERREYFVALDEAQDLGDQARYPPSLDQVGRKLRAQRLREVLETGARSRPYIAARMPLFGAANVGHLVEALGAQDLRPGDDLEPELDAERLALGQKLAGRAGLGCIQCHAFAGYAGVGSSAVDLADSFAHLRPAWFRELLSDPKALGLNSRMPEFWSEGKSPVRDVYAGDPARQIDALRAYLSLGRDAPLPEGLVVPEGAYELLVHDEPVLCGVFMQGVSPRTMVVGTPAGVHYAFDMQNSRLAKVWRGRFFNARGTWDGRAGALERPPVSEVRDLPAGMPLALLDSPDAPWPTAMGADAGFRRLGHAFDAERYPVWRYALGELVIEERLRPRIEGGMALERGLRIECELPEPPGNLFARTEHGRERVTFERADTRGGTRWVALLATEVRL